MFEKMTMREWSTSSTPTTPAPGLLSLAEPDTDTIVSSKDKQLDPVFTGDISPNKFYMASK